MHIPVTVTTQQIPFISRILSQKLSFTHMTICLRYATLNTMKNDTYIWHHRMEIGR